jgi:predicted RNA-binding Zn ribbon-like protein
MDPLPLASGSYGGTYKLVGGQLSLDLINTVSWPGTPREHDWFEPVTNVTLWAIEVGLIDARTRRRLDEGLAHDPTKWTGDLAGVRDIRETLRAVVSPFARGDTHEPQLVERLNQLVARTCGRRRLDPETLQWTWTVPTTLVDLMAPVIWNAGEVLSTIDPKRLGYCPSCDWLFHDTTRNRSRRWCDMVDCGSRDKALRYYHRRKRSASRAAEAVDG